MRAAVTSNENRTATLDRRVYAVSLAYRKGPWYAFYTYEEHRDLKAATPKESGNAVGGKVRLGPLEPGGTWQQYDKTNLTRKGSYLLSVDYHLAASELIHQYQDARGAGGLGTTGQDSAGFSLGLRHVF